MFKCTNLWGTRYKWIDDPTVTPTAFKKADAKMLNSIVDALMEKWCDEEEAERPTKKIGVYTPISHQTVNTNKKNCDTVKKSKKSKDLINCSGCMSLGSLVECERNACNRQSKGGNGE